MRLILVRHLWGLEGSWDEQFPSIREKGYAAVEAGLPGDGNRRTFDSARHRSGLGWVAMVFTDGIDVKAHLESLRRQVDEAVDSGPLLINCHGGRDAFSEDEAKAFFAGALEIEARLGIPIGHETHRGRILYNPWITDRMLTRFPGLKLTADFSHWVCVAERLLDDQEDIMRRCAARTLHVHARVGYEQGPQVPDPRAPEYAPHLEVHERWWAWIWEAQQEAGSEACTLTPEFGPPDYLHTAPYTRLPVADLGAICDWQAERQRRRFEEWRAAQAPR